MGGRVGSGCRDVCRVDEALTDPLGERVTVLEDGVRAEEGDGWLECRRGWMDATDGRRVFMGSTQWIGAPEWLGEARDAFRVDCVDW